MEKWTCKICGYIYDPEKGDPDGDISPNTPFDKLPDSWVTKLGVKAKLYTSQAKEKDAESKDEWRAWGQS